MISARGDPKSSLIAIYDVKEIKEHSISLNHVPIIDKCARNKAQKKEIRTDRKRDKILKFSTAENTRYKNRFPKERFNALYKDHFGGRNLLYKGYTKSFCHVMFGVLALAGLGIIKLIQ